MAKGIKTEHGGAKHAKGYWGRKQDAKQVSKKARRNEDTRLARER